MEPPPDHPKQLALFTEQLSLLHHIGLELARAASFDEMCRQAVIAWYERLKLDRIGLWFVCPDNPDKLCGSFGIDEYGRVRDERGQSFDNDAPIFLEIQHHQQRVFHAVNQQLFDHRSQPVGQGETAAAALWDGDKVIGFAVTDNLISRQPMTPYHREILYLFGQLIGHLASQKRSEKVIREHARRFRLLNAITHAAISQDDITLMLFTLADRFAELLDARSCALTLWDDATEALTLGAMSNAPPTAPRPPTPQQVALTRQALAAGRSVLVQSHQAHSNDSAACFLAIPIIANRLRLGAILIETYENQVLSEAEIAIAADAAEQIALAILKAQLLDETRRQLRETETLRQAGLVVASTLSLEDALKRILDELRRVVPYDTATIQQRRDDELEIVGVRGFADEHEVLGMRLPLDHYAPEALVAEQQAAYLLDEIPAAYHASGGLLYRDVHSWMGAPLLLHDQMIGMLTLGSRQPANFTPAHARLVTAFAVHVTISLENARLFHEVRRLATHDQLTGVFTRRHFMELAQRACHQAERYGETLSLIMFDLDRFKSINDSLGHIAGDQVLREVAQTCLKQLRIVDIMGRYGGEEFVILMPHTAAHIAGASAQSCPALHLAERLRAAVERLVVTTAYGTVQPTISVGVSGRAHGCKAIEQLIDAADQALLDAKAAGRNRVTLFSYDPSPVQ